MLDYLDTTECRMVFLRRQLDDPSADAVRTLRRLHRHGVEQRRGDGRCRGRPTSGSPGRASRWRPGNSGPPAWPARGAGVGADPGRRAGGVRPRDRAAVRHRLGHPAARAARGRRRRRGHRPRGRQRLGDGGWGEGGEHAGGWSADQPVPKEVLDACVRVLAGWGWAERPVGVVGMGSRTRPHQLAHLARRIAEIGRLPLLGTLAPHGPRPAVHANSAQRLAAVWSAVGEPRVRRSAGPGAARRRRDRHRLDGHGRRSHPPPGGRGRRAAVRPGRGGLISAGARPVLRPPSSP